MATVPELWGLEFSAKKIAVQAGRGIYVQTGLQLLEDVEHTQT